MRRATGMGALGAAARRVLPDQTPEEGSHAQGSEGREEMIGKGMPIRRALRMPMQDRRESEWLSRPVIRRNMSSATTYKTLNVVYFA